MTWQRHRGWTIGIIAIAVLLALRGIVILSTPADPTGWTRWLGIGGPFMDGDGSLLGRVLTVVALIEGRLWIILAFPLLLRLAWGRDLAVLVALLGIVVQGFRLAYGSGAPAGLWLLADVSLALIFAAAPGVRAYFAPRPSADHPAAGAHESK
jgi:hypothetical protein